MSKIIRLKGDPIDRIDVKAGDVLLGPDNTSRTVVMTYPVHELLYTISVDSNGYGARDFIVGDKECLHLDTFYSFEKFPPEINVPVWKFLSMEAKQKQGLRLQVARKNRKRYEEGTVEIKSVKELSKQVYNHIEVDGDGLFLNEDRVILCSYARYE